MTRSRADEDWSFIIRELPRSRSLWKAGISPMTLTRRSDFWSSAAKFVRRSTNDFLIASGFFSGRDRRKTSLRSRATKRDFGAFVQPILVCGNSALSGYVGEQLLTYQL